MIKNKARIEEEITKIKNTICKLEAMKTNGSYQCLGKQHETICFKIDLEIKDLKSEITFIEQYALAPATYLIEVELPQYQNLIQNEVEKWHSRFQKECALKRIEEILMCPSEGRKQVFQKTQNAIESMKSVMDLVGIVTTDVKDFQIALDEIENRTPNKEKADNQNDLLP